MKIRENHPIRRMTPAQRLEWFGKSDQCRGEDHNACTTYTRFRYKGMRYPCGCGCHWEEGT